MGARRPTTSSLATSITTSSTLASQHQLVLETPALSAMQQLVSTARRTARLTASLAGASPAACPAPRPPRTPLPHALVSLPEQLSHARTSQFEKGKTHALFVHFCDFKLFYVGPSQELS